MGLESWNEEEFKKFRQIEGKSHPAKLFFYLLFFRLIGINDKIDFLK
jgi:hypothetical protein